MKNSKHLCALLCTAALLIGGTLTACSKTPASADTDGLSKAYAAIFANIRKRYAPETIASDMRYFYHDIDGDGTPELFVTEDYRIDAYAVTDGQAAFLDSFTVGTSYFLYDSGDDRQFPGLFYRTIGGGSYFYWYMTVKDGALLNELVWQDHYGLYEENNPLRTEIDTKDRALAARSAQLVKEEVMMTFLDLDLG